MTPQHPSTWLVALVASLAMSNSVAAEPPPPCDALYYGIDRKVDLAAAHACYARVGDHEMLALMAANGEGTPRDLDRAREEARLAVKGSSNPQGQQADALVSAIERQAGTSAAKALAYCDDVARADDALNRCAWIRLGVDSTRHDATLDAMAAKLTPPSVRALAALRTTVRLLRTAENARGQLKYHQGSLSVRMGIAHEASVLDAFVTLVTEVIARAQPAWTAQELATARAELAASAKRDLADFAGAHPTRDPDPTQRALMKRHVGDYRRASADCATRWTELEAGLRAFAIATHGPAGADPLANVAVDLCTARRMLLDLRGDGE